MKHDEDTKISRRHLLHIGGVVLVGTAAGCGTDPLAPADVGSAGDSDPEDAVGDSGFDAETDTLDASQDVRDLAHEPDLVDDAGDDRAVDTNVDEEPGTPPPTEPFFILHLTDTHIGDHELAAPALILALNEVLGAVNPNLTILSGDIVDEGDDTNMWSEYQEAVEGVTAAEIYEAPGNHDSHNDLDLNNYLAESITGQETGVLFGHRVIEVGGRRVRVVSVNTASGNSRLVNLTGYLADDQVEELIDSIEADSVQVDQTVVFGHHPMLGVNGLSLHGTADNLRRLLQATSASVYLFGHFHFYRDSWEDGVLHVQGPTLGKPVRAINDPGFCLIGIDDDGPSARLIELEWEGANASVPWPLVLITQPGDADLADENPVTATLQRNTSGYLLRAGVFSPDTIDEVSFRVDESPWEPMTRVGNWYEAELTTTAWLQMNVEVRAVSGFHEGSHRISVRLE